MNRKIILFLLLFVLFILNGCAKSDASEKIDHEDSYSVSSFSVGGIEGYELVDCKCYCDSICMIGRKEYSDNPDLYDYFYIEDDYSGSHLNTIKIVEKSDIYIENFCKSEKGNILVVYDRFNEIEEWECVAVIFDNLGNELAVSNSALDGIIDSSAYICPFSSDCFLAQRGRELVLFDSEFNIKKKNDIEYDCKIVSSYDNSAYVLFKEDGNDRIARIDEDSLDFCDITSCEFSYTDWNILSGNKKYIFMVNDGENLYGFSSEKGAERVLNFFDCGLSGGNGLDTWIIDEENTIKAVEFYNVEFESPCVNISVFTKRENDERKIITIGCQKRYGGPWEEALEFNRQSNDYKIKMIDYSDYVTQDDPHGDRNKILLDLSNGDLPDILVLEEPYMVDLLKSKKVFVSLEPYIEKDDSIDIDNYFPNIIEAGSYKGDLVAYIPQVSLSTLIISEEKRKSINSWTVNDLKALLSSNDFDQSALYGASREDIIRMMIYSNSNILNDRECNFACEDFYEILELAKVFPSYNSFSFSDMEKEIEAFRTKASTIDYVDIIWTGGYSYYKDVVFGEPISVLGFPNEKGGKSLMKYDTAFSITKSCKYPQGAWEFIRHFMTEEYRPKDKGTLSTNISVFRKRAKEVEKSIWYLPGGESIDINPLSDEEIDKLYDAIANADTISNCDNEIERIIEEETQPYFSGQKTASEIGEIIQSRVEIYLREKH